jgi:hypothetical protein
MFTTPLVLAAATDHANPKVVQLYSPRAQPESLPCVARRYQDPAILPLLGLRPRKRKSARRSAIPPPLQEAIAKALPHPSRRREPQYRRMRILPCGPSQRHGRPAASPGIPADYELEARQARTTPRWRLAEQQLFQIQDPRRPSTHGVFALQITAANRPAALDRLLIQHIAALQRRAIAQLWHRPAP